MTKAQKKREAHDEKAAADRARTQQAVGQSLQTTVEHAGGMYSQMALGDTQAAALVCPVPVSDTRKYEMPTWMRRLHEQFVALAQRWEDARRRPDSTDPSRQANVLALSTGTKPDRLVIYVPYDPLVPDAILNSLVDAANFAGLCNVKSLAMNDPSRMGTTSSLSALEAALDRIAEAGVRVTIHDNRALATR